MCEKRTIIAALVLVAYILSFISCDAECLVEVKPEYDKLFSYPVPTKERYAQGLEILNGDVFQAYSDGTIDIYDLKSGHLKQTIGPLIDEKGIYLHMNDLTFRNYKGSSFLIVPGNDINSSIFVYSINLDGNTYKLDTCFSFDPPYIDDKKCLASTQYFGEGNSIVQVAYKRTENNGYGDVIIQGYSFDAISTDIMYIKKWEIEHEILWAMQGAVIKGDICYMAVGVPSGDAKIYRIGAEDGSISCSFDLREEKNSIPGEEMQGITFYDGSFYFSTTYGLYKLNII